MRAPLAVIVALVVGIAVGHGAAQEASQPLVPAAFRLSDAAAKSIAADWLKPDERKDLRVFHGVWDERDLDTPARETRGGLERRGIAVIDLLPALAAAERDGRTYATRDSHWNERGNAVAAEVLAQMLEAPVRRIAAARDAAPPADAQPRGSR